MKRCILVASVVLAGVGLSVSGFAAPPKAPVKSGPAGTPAAGGGEATTVPTLATLLEGLCTEWSREGNKILEGSYRDGARHGEWSSWYPDGRFRRKSEYVDGVLKNDLERQKREQGAAKEGGG